VDLHVLVDPDMSVRRGHEICDAVRNRLIERGPRIIDVLVHLEPFETGREETALTWPAENRRLTGSGQSRDS